MIKCADRIGIWSVGFCGRRARESNPGPLVGGERSHHGTVLVSPRLVLYGVEIAKTELRLYTASLYLRIGKNKRAKHAGVGVGFVSEASKNRVLFCTGIQFSCHPIRAFG